MNILIIGTKIKLLPIYNYCKEKGIEWFASAWDLKSQDFLNGFDCKYNKVASAMIIYSELLKLCKCNNSNS